jgi:hypothetical protein
MLLSSNVVLLVRQNRGGLREATVIHNCRRRVRGPDREEKALDVSSRRTKRGTGFCLKDVNQLPDAEIFSQVAPLGIGKFVTIVPVKQLTDSIASCLTEFQAK